VGGGGVPQIFAEISGGSEGESMLFGKISRGYKFLQNLGGAGAYVIPPTFIYAAPPTYHKVLFLVFEPLKLETSFSKFDLFRKLLFTLLSIED
jgi:hypothetical protein